MHTIRKDQFNLQEFDEVGHIVGLVVTTLGGSQAIWRHLEGDVYYMLGEDSHQFGWLKTFNERKEKEKHKHDIVLWGLYETDGKGRPTTLVDVAKYKRSHKSRTVLYEMACKKGISNTVYYKAEEIKATPEQWMENNNASLRGLKERIKREKEIFSKIKEL
tara:strand:- start:12001 stop:12483 length:483 start_codon:yes stop_codon:yes gene_type:complete